MRTEVIGDCTLMLGDCREILPTLGRVDCVVTDPPYGLGRLWAGGGGHNNNSWKFDPNEARAWDGEAPDWLPDLIGETTAIVWGGNFFKFPCSRSWLVWDKGIPDFTTGHSELAWTNLDIPIRNFRLCPNVMTPSGRDGKKQHPTQKPVALMEWCIRFIPAAHTIVDIFAGSGTTGVACARLGRRFIGCEIDERYFTIACRRIEAAYKQPDMFVQAPASKPVTPDMFGTTP